MHIVNQTYKILYFEHKLHLKGQGMQRRYAMNPPSCLLGIWNRGLKALRFHASTLYRIRRQSIVHSRKRPNGSGRTFHHHQFNIIRSSSYIYNNQGQAAGEQRRQAQLASSRSLKKAKGKLRYERLVNWVPSS
jgi:hypothetical protein